MTTETPSPFPHRILAPGARRWAVAVTVACLASGFLAHLAAREAGLPPASTPSSPSPAQPTVSYPAVGRFVFGITPALPQTTPPLLPAEARIVFGFAPWPAGARREEVQARWSWQGGPMQEAPVAPIRAPGGAILARVTLEQTPPAALGPGLGEVELRAHGRRTAHGCFVLAAQAARVLAQQTPPSAQTRVANLLIGASLGPEGRVVRSQGSFGPLDRVYVSFSYSGADLGAGFVVHWYAEDNELQRAKKTLTVNAEAGTGNVWLQARGKGLPPGRYRVTVCYGADPIPLAQAEFRVQPGQTGKSGTASPATKAAPGAVAAPRRWKN